MQQLTCNIDLSSSLINIFFSFVLLELKPFVLRGKSWGKNSEKVRKSVKNVKNYERFRPLVVAGSRKRGVEFKGGAVIQGKTPWVDQSCADCPGFPVLGAGDAPPPELHPGASKCAPGLAFAFTALRANSWICCPQLPDHPSKNGTHSTCFCSTRGHTPSHD